MSARRNPNGFAGRTAGNGQREPAEISIQNRGKSVSVPMCRVEGREVISVGRYLRLAMLKDEEWLDGEPIADLSQFVSALRATGLSADIFALSGAIDAAPFDGIGQFEIENWAAVRTDDYEAWWQGLPQEARKNTRRAAKKGIEVRSATLDDEFVAGVKAIYDETPIRQGREFWHYGKDIDTIKQENGTYLDRGELLGAYYCDQLVGFIKFVYVGNAARIMQILCLNSHQDKRPIFALLSKAVEICHQKGFKYFVYGKFTYGH